MKHVCSFSECGRAALSRGLCQSHYAQQRRGEALRPIRAQKRTKQVKPCGFKGCDNWGFYGELCWSHDQQKKKGKELAPLRPQPDRLGTCEVDDCERMAAYKGMCSPHRKQFNRGKIPGPIRGEYPECRVEGCGRPVGSKGLCQTHYRYWKRGDELKPITEPTYKYRTTGGYIRVYDFSHINATKNGQLLEHVKVMADHLGRRIRTEAGENVHHRNGIKDDNRLENLELWASWSQPKGQRVADLLAFARGIIDTYAAEEHLLAS